jgi:hypothetical protein
MTKIIVDGAIWKIFLGEPMTSNILRLSLTENVFKKHPLVVKENLFETLPSIG